MALKLVSTLHMLEEGPLPPPWPNLLAPNGESPVHQTLERGRVLLPTSMGMVLMQYKFLITEHEPAPVLPPAVDQTRVHTKAVRQNCTQALRPLPWLRLAPPTQLQRPICSETHT